MINKSILVGNIGAKPELRYTKSGVAVLNFNLCTVEKWRDKAGEFQESAEWHRIVVWADAAERNAEKLDKGDTVYIEGVAKTRSWEKKGQKHYTTEVHARKCSRIIDRNKMRTNDVPTEQPPLPEPTMSDDVPF